MRTDENNKYFKSLSENGARLCRRPAAARGKHLNAPRIRDLLRLVEDDTAALRDFQTRFKHGGSYVPDVWNKSFRQRPNGFRVGCPQEPCRHRGRPADCQAGKDQPECRLEIL